MLSPKKEYFLKTKIALEKGVRYEKKQRSGLKCEVGEELLKYLGKNMTYRYPWLFRNRL